MWGRYYIPEEDSAEELHLIIEEANRKSVENPVKAGEITPTDTAPMPHTHWYYFEWESVAGRKSSTPLARTCVGSLTQPGSTAWKAAGRFSAF